MSSSRLPRPALMQKRPPLLPTASPLLPPIPMDHPAGSGVEPYRRWSTPTSHVHLYRSVRRSCRARALAPNPIARRALPRSGRRCRLHLHGAKIRGRRRPRRRGVY